MKTLAVALAVAVFTPTAAHAAPSLTRGPYVQNTRPDSVVIAFDTSTSTPAEVVIGGRTIQSPAGVHHEVTVDDLDPDTAYDYQVRIGGVAVSDTHELSTAVEPGSPFSFVIYGDTRTNEEQHLETITAIEAEVPHMVVQTGDLVADGGDVDDWNEFFAIEQPLLAQVPLFPAVGNHDETGGDAELYREAFALPDEELYYSFDYGSAHFTILDGEARIADCKINGKKVDDCFDPEQLAWLEADLEAARERPEIAALFVLTHEGPYSSRIFRRGSAHMRALMPLFAERGVTAVISGHDHYYERGRSGNGVPYIITGGAAAPLYSIGAPSPDPHTVIFNKKIHHYLVVDVEGDEVRIRTKTPSGTVIDDVTLDAHPDLASGAKADDPAAAPAEPAPPTGCAAAGPTGLPGVLAAVALAASLRFRRRRRRS